VIVHLDPRRKKTPSWGGVLWPGNEPSAETLKTIGINKYYCDKEVGIGPSAFCKFCFKKYAFQNTGKLLTHLRKSCTSEAKDFAAKVSANSSSHQTKYGDKAMPDDKRLKYSIQATLCCIHSGMSLRMMEDPHFRELYIGLSSVEGAKYSAGTTPPSVKFVKVIMKVIYTLMKNKVKAELTAAKEFYGGLKFAAIYADCWTSRKGGGFVGVELSYVRNTDDRAYISTVCLGCRHLQGSHDGPRIAALIVEVVIFRVVLFVSTLISFLIIRFWLSTVSR
jgi:hypothetical protein